MSAVTEREANPHAARADLRPALWAALIALLCTGLIEAARVPLRVYGGVPQLALGVYLLALWRALLDLAPSVLLVPAVGLVRWLHARRSTAATGNGKPPPSVLGPALIAAALGALAAFDAYRTLARYPDFAGYPPAVALFTMLGVGAGLASALQARTLAASARRALRALGLLLPLALAGGAAACFALNALVFPGDYPTLHLSLVQIGLLLLSLGLLHAFERWPALLERLSLRTLARPERAPRARKIALGTMLALLLSAVALVLLGKPPAIARARPYFTMYTTLGQAQPLLTSRLRDAPDESLMDEARARALFARHSGLPELPADFALQRYNVLLVMSEAVRADQSSVARPKLKTTPHMQHWSQRGAIELTRAFTPSSGTYQSLAGLFGMSYPSFLSMEVWRKAWTGHFRDPGPTVAEVFRRSGYDTFWVSHNNANCFTYTVRGYDRGFSTQKLITAKQSKRANADVRIARGAIQQLERVAKSKQRFFGWVFFVSPHSSYSTHYDDMPADTPLQRYRQELRFMDEQIGALLSSLERLELLDDTIVIFTSDHGEEFGEHGGRHHKSTVYTESVQVPLLIWLPGGKNAKLHAPTATAYLFPWLFLRGGKTMQDAALLRLRRDLGPMLERTDGAVVVELLGDQRMKSALIYPDRKYNYDFAAELHEAYRDPGEHSDLYQLDRKVTADAEQRMGAYLQLRSERQRFVLRPDVMDPRPDRD